MNYRNETRSEIMTTKRIKNMDGVKTRAPRMKLWYVVKNYDFTEKKKKNMIIIFKTKETT